VCCQRRPWQSALRESDTRTPNGFAIAFPLSDHAGGDGNSHPIGSLPGYNEKGRARRPGPSCLGAYPVYTAYGSLPVIVIAGELKPSNVSA
jgi:hypothetical protein